MAKGQRSTKFIINIRSKNYKENIILLYIHYLSCKIKILLNLFGYGNTAINDLTRVGGQK